MLAAAAPGGCAHDRPVHPYRLEGFPGAPIEPGLFPLRPGARWVFRDRLQPERTLELSLVDDGGSGGGLALAGSKDGPDARIRVRDGFVEVVRDGEVVDRLLKLEGRVGDRWRAAGAVYTVFGYDRLDVLGETRRALVVAADRGDAIRDLYWFVEDVGWARIRTEHQGKARRDAVLESFGPGAN